jgi:NADPH-dependent glutamate synthase beta subunit-like oxidoreductase
MRKDPSAGSADKQRLRIEIPGDHYHRELISCQVACPVHTDARGYVRAVAEGRFEEAYLIARGPNPFASICGRICGAPCEAACRRGLIPRVGPDGGFAGRDRPVSIRALKRFASERGGLEAVPPQVVLEASRSFVPKVGSDVYELAALVQARVQGRFEPGRSEKVAVIGAGPAGLSAAHDLALMGFSPVVFESEPLPAGMLAFGVPEYRLPRELIRMEIAVIRVLGVEIVCGKTVGRDVSFQEIRRSHAAVVVSVGAKRARSLGLPGERGPGVYGGVDLLRAAALGEPFGLGRSVVVVGGGNVAYDVARTVLRQAAWDTARTAARFPGFRKVRLVSLETLEEMPADTVEIVEGDEEGIERMNGWGPVEVVRDAGGAVTGLVLRRCLQVYDRDRRFAPVFEERDRRMIPCDTVLFAAGQMPDLSFLGEGGGEVEEARPGWPKADPETLMTTARGVFVAGDLAHGTRLLIDAVASGKRAARGVYRYLTGRAIRAERMEAFLLCEGYRREAGYERIRRVEVPARPPAERLADPSVSVELGYREEEARREASRCLDCGVSPVFDGSRCILCGGCADVCPTSCLKLVSLDLIHAGADLGKALEQVLGSGAVPSAHSAVIKDEERCIRCGLCADRCPADAIRMERITSVATLSSVEAGRCP